MTFLQYDDCAFLQYDDCVARVWFKRITYSIRGMISSTLFGGVAVAFDRGFVGPGMSLVWNGWKDLFEFY